MGPDLAWLLILAVGFVGAAIVRALERQTAALKAAEDERREDREADKRAERDHLRWRRVEALWQEPIPLMEAPGTCEVCRRTSVLYDFGGPTCLDCTEQAVGLALDKLRRHA